MLLRNNGELTDAWYAVYVLPKCEHKVALSLEIKGYDHFLPLCSSKRRWSDRTKLVKSPLFPRYVFCRIRDHLSGLILTTPGVMRIVGFGGQPFPIPESEIAALRQVIQSGLESHPFPFLALGQRVTVAAGPLSGITGILVQRKNQNRVIVSVTLIAQSVSIDVSAWDLVAASESGTSSPDTQPFRLVPK
jgi:transcriptional antiterminator RfaH